MPVALHELDGEPYLWCPYGSRAQWYRNVAANPVVTVQSDRTRVMRAVPVEDLEDLMAIVEDLRRFDETFWRSYLASEGIEDTDESIAAHAERVHVRRLVPTDEQGPEPLARDLAWSWAAVPLTAVAAVALVRRATRCRVTV